MLLFAQANGESNVGPGGSSDPSGCYRLSGTFYWTNGTSSRHGGNCTSSKVCYCGKALTKAPSTAPSKAPSTAPSKAPTRAPLNSSHWLQAGYKKHANKICDPRGKHNGAGTNGAPMHAGADAFRAAIKQCNGLGARCVGLYDYKCDGGGFTICNGSSFSKGLTNKTSNGSSFNSGCAYEKSASEHALDPPLQLARPRDALTASHDSALLLPHDHP